jgi:hypothetical protein
VGAFGLNCLLKIILPVDQSNISRDFIFQPVGGVDDSRDEPGDVVTPWLQSDAPLMFD